MSKEKPKPATKKASTKPAAKATAATRRPDATLPPTKQSIDFLTGELLDMIKILDIYAANLRALDRQRHNGVGIKRLGFIEAAFRISSKFPQYFPHWLTTAKFKRDLDLYNSVRSLIDACRSLEEKAWNINVEAADMALNKAPRQAVWMKKINTAWRTIKTNNTSKCAKALA